MSKVKDDSPRKSPQLGNKSPRGRVGTAPTATAVPPPIRSSPQRRLSGPRSLPQSSTFEHLKTLPMALVQLEFLEGSFEVGGVALFKDAERQVATESLLEALCYRTSNRAALIEYFLEQGAPIKKTQFSHPIIPALQEQTVPEEEYLRAIELLLKAGVNCSEKILHPTTNVLDLAFMYGSTAAVSLILQFYGEDSLQHCVTPRWMIWSLVGDHKKLRKHLHRRKKEHNLDDLSQTHPFSEFLTPERFAQRGTALLCAASENLPDVITVLLHYGAKINLTTVYYLKPAKSTPYLRSTSTATGAALRRSRSSGSRVSTGSAGSRTSAQSGSSSHRASTNRGSTSSIQSLGAEDIHELNFTALPFMNATPTSSMSDTDPISLANFSLDSLEDSESYAAPNALQVSSSLYHIEATCALLESLEATAEAILPIYTEVLLQFRHSPFTTHRKQAHEVLCQLGSRVSLQDVLDKFEKEIQTPEDFGILKYMACVFCGDNQRAIERYRSLRQNSGSMVDRETNYCLHSAVISDQVELLRGVGTRRALNNSATDPHRNVWYQAAIHNSAPILEALFTDGMPQPEAAPAALMMFVYHGRDHFVRLLCDRLGNKLNLNEAYPYVNLQKIGKKTMAKTPLQLACKMKHLTVAQELVAQGATLDYVGSKQYDCKYPPLFLAVSHGSIEIVQMLLGHGADVNTTASEQAKKHLSVFQRAVQLGHIPIAELLMEKGVNMRKPSALAALLMEFPQHYPQDVCRRYIKKFFKAGCSFHDDVTDYQSRVSIAVFAGCYSGSREMIDHLWAVNILRDQILFTRAVIIACQYGQEDIVKYLMAHYAEQKKPAQLNMKQPLKIAIRSQQVGITHFLLHTPLVRPGVPAVDGMKAIDYAVRKNDFELFTVLCEAGQHEPSVSSYQFLMNSSADLNRQFFEAFAEIDTAELTFAALQSKNPKVHDELIHLLGDARLRPNERNDKGQTLLLACYETFPDNLDLLDVLLRRTDIDPNLTQIKGDITLLYAASTRGDDRTVALLLETHGDTLEYNYPAVISVNHKVTPIYAAASAYINGKPGGLKIVEALVNRVDPTKFSETKTRYSDSKKENNEVMMQIYKARRQSASSAMKLSSNNFQARNGVTYRTESVMHLACSVGCTELIDVLRSRFSFTASADVMTAALYLVMFDRCDDNTTGEPDFPLLTKYLTLEALSTKSAMNVEALSLAVFRDNVLLVDYLLKRGLDPNSRGRYVNTVKNESHMSDQTYPLCHAAELGRRSIVDRILNDERVNIRTAGDGLAVCQEGSPLRSAYKSNHLTISAKILSHYPTFDPTQIISDILGSNGTTKPELEFDKLKKGMLSHLNMKEDQIPDRFRSSSDRTLQYLYDLAQGQQEVRRLRVIIVGPAAAGKTTIVKRLVGENWNGTQLQHFDEAYMGYQAASAPNKGRRRKRKGVTDGIDVHYWKPRDQPVAIFLWDFAGQEIYYTTHQFFLAPNSLYLIVFNASLPLKHGNIVYWLNSLQSRVKGQQVLLIATHTDKLSKRESRLQELNEEIQCIYHRWTYQFEPGEELIRLVPQSDGTVIWPVAKKESLAHIERAMIRNAEEKKPIPNKYMLLRNQVNHLRSTTSPPVMEKEKLIEMARAVGIGPRETNLALELLHEWGELMYFPSGWHLGKKIILDPRWLSDLFKTVSSFKFRTKDGEYSALLSLTELKERWRDACFGPELDLFLIELLEHFQIMVKAPKKEDIYIVPSLLSSSPPLGHWTPLRTLAGERSRKSSKSTTNEFIPTEEYYREYHLPFSPSGLISRLLAHFFLLGHRGDLDIVHYWEGGVVLADSKTQTDILVTLEEDNKSTFGRIIEVIIRGPPTQWRSKMAFFHSLVTGIIFEWYPGIRNRIKIFVGKSTEAGCELYLPYEDCVDQFLQKTPSEYGNTIAELLPELTQPIIQWGQGDLKSEDLTQSKLQFEREVQIIKKLGGGMFGHVFKAKWQDKLVAVKTLSADTPNRDDIMDFCKEVAILKALDHPAIVKLLYFFPCPMAIVTELVTGGDLESFIRTHYASITWEVFTKMLLDVARAILYMHSLEPPIYHNDIKVANVLVIDLNAQEPDVSVKLADVGCARMASAGGSAGSTDFMGEEKKQFCGLLIDLFEAAAKGSQGPYPPAIVQLMTDAREDNIPVPFFANIIKRLQFIQKYLGDSGDEVHTKMEQLHVLEQLEGAVHANERDAVLEILGSAELHALGKRSHRLTHQIFMSAIKKEDISFFTALLDTNAWGVNTYLNEAHSYLIHTICKLGNDTFLRILLEKQVNIEAVDPVHEQTALHVAIEANQPRIVKILLANFADVDAVDALGRTPAMIAAQMGHFECLEQLIRGNVNPNTGFGHRVKHEKRASLLKEALVVHVTPEHIKCIKCLLENGATRPQGITTDQMQVVIDCAFELFQFMCFAEPTVARQTAIGLISLFCTCSTIELQQLQELLSSVINENREKQVSRRDRMFKILDTKRGVSIKPEIFEKTIPSTGSRMTNITFTLKNHNKNEVTALLLLPKSSHYRVTCPMTNLTIKSGGSATVTCDILLQKPIITAAAILVETETPTSIEYHYIIARLFPLNDPNQAATGSGSPTFSGTSSDGNRLISVTRMESL